MSHYVKHIIGIILYLYKHNQVDKSKVTNAWWGNG